MSREHEDRILIRLSGALSRLNFTKGLRVLTETLPLIAGSSTCPLLGKEMPLVGIEKALSDLPVDALPSRRALRFPVSFSAAVIVFCSSIATIQSKTSFRLGDMCFSRKLSITEDLSRKCLSLAGFSDRIFTSRSQACFHVDRAGALRKSPRFLFLQRFLILKRNSFLMQDNSCIPFHHVL